MEADGRYKFERKPRRRPKGRLVDQRGVADGSRTWTVGYEIEVAPRFAAAEMTITG